MRTQTRTAAKATRPRKPAATKKAASAAKAPTKAKAKAKPAGKAKTTGRANGVAAAALMTTSNRGARSAAGSKSQAAKSAKRSAGKSQQRGRRPGTGKSSSQSGAAPQHQGEGTMSPQAQAPMFGGTRQVLIEEVVMTNRGGRKQGPEPYPFGDLTPSRMEGGAIHGPSFFIPESENPKRIIAAGRKRHKGVGKVFLTRQMEGPSAADPAVKVSGTRVWLAPPGYNE